MKIECTKEEFARIVRWCYDGKIFCSDCKESCVFGDFCGGDENFLTDVCEIVEGEE